MPTTDWRCPRVGGRFGDTQGRTAENVPVRAEVVSVPRDCAPADAAEIIDWLRDGGAPSPSASALVRGQPDAA
ncbi:hypothetical protein [Streptomyces albicerus]|uniref:hypothetical protein n=1 Tax=Streptomyces albicerus TaxID=2569859 RepID=UPI001788CDBD|nr:hypothetical protein [Streptomyces albicerus]